MRFRSATHLFGFRGASSTDVAPPSSVLDALLGFDALVVGVLDLAHLGHSVGQLHELGVFAGFCYTQFSDTYQEANGLLYADRTPKFPLDAIHAATTGNPAAAPPLDTVTGSPRAIPPADAEKQDT